MTPPPNPSPPEREDPRIGDGNPLDDRQIENEEAALVPERESERDVETLRRYIFPAKSHTDLRASEALDRLAGRLHEVEGELSWRRNEQEEFSRLTGEALDQAERAETQLGVAREGLEEIAGRQWRDEGGRIAAAIARDGLAGTGRFDPALARLYPEPPAEQAEERA